MTNRGIRAAAACALAVVLASSCRNPISSRIGSKGDTSSPTASLTLRFTPGSSGSAKAARAAAPISRTIVPTFSTAISTVSVKISGAGPTQTQSAAWGNNIKITFGNIAAGSWNISASALSSTGATIGSGSASATVADGLEQQATVPIQLATATGAGTGTLNLLVRWPVTTPPATTPPVDGLSSSILTSAGATAVPSQTPITSDGSYYSTTINQSLPSGTNVLTLSFTRSGAPAGTFVEAVNIFPGCTSDTWLDSHGVAQNSWTLSAADFLDATASLTSLAIDSVNYYTFFPDVYSYSGIQIDADTLSFTPTRGMPGQTINYTWVTNGGTASGTVSSGTKVTGLAFAAGGNTLTVKVIAPDGVTTKSYVLTVMAYTISYDANGATSGSPPASYIGPSGRVVSLASVGSLQQAGNACTGWYTNPSGSGGTFYAASSSYTIGSSDLQLYALWENASLAGLDPNSSTWVLAGSLSNSDCTTLRAMLDNLSAAVTLDLGQVTGGLPSQLLLQNCHWLGGIVLPSGTTRIPFDYFDGCSNLASVQNFGTSCTVIEDNAFKGCMSLHNFTIPTSVISIGNSAFQNCKTLNSITTIPSNVTSIGEAAFQGCETLTNIIIPNSVTSLGPAAFQDCTGLNFIEFGSGISAIPQTACQGCTNLSSVIFDGPIIGMGDSAFAGCTNLSTINISSVSGTIGLSAFAGSGLTSISIPNGVTSIGSGAFDSCASLSAVHVQSSVPPTLGTGAFDNEMAGRIIYVPSGCLSSYSTATNWDFYYNLVPSNLQEE